MVKLPKFGSLMKASSPKTLSIKLEMKSNILSSATVLSYIVTISIKIKISI